LSEGDRIAATLAVSDSRSWLENVRVTARAGAADVPRPAIGRAMPGTAVPDLPLLDQTGSRTTLRGSAGRVLVVTFIYTRCPLPDFCPLMVKHLETVRRRVNRDGLGTRLALLGLTLDPAIDTPDVLRAYGEAVLEGSDRYEQWTLATGTATQIEDAARFFGVGYRAERGFITHTLTTAVVGQDGRIIRIFESNSWRADDLYDVVRRAIDAAAAE
jgi:protein SCO1/2